MAMKKKNYSRTNYTHAWTECLLYSRGWKVEPTASYAARRNGQRFAPELVDRILSCAANLLALGIEGLK